MHPCRIRLIYNSPVSFSTYCETVNGHFHHLMAIESTADFLNMKI